MRSIVLSDSQENNIIFIHVENPWAFVDFWDYGVNGKPDLLSLNKKPCKCLDSCVHWVYTLGGRQSAPFIWLCYMIFMITEG